MKPYLLQPRVSRVLQSLFADAAKSDPRIRKAARMAYAKGQSEAEHYFHNLRNAYIPVGPEFGNLLYTLVRSTRAKSVVEFGTSFGISTIYLASAVRDNGRGKVISTEFVPEKAARAQENLRRAGLADRVDIRVGNVLETLKSGLPRQIDVLFLDGAKGLYIDVLKLLEPHLRSGAIVASDNTDQEQLKKFLAYIRSPRNGYVSSGLISIHRGKATGHEISVRQ
jgi:predicted O-methyltransferase YrrM